MTIEKIRDNRRDFDLALTDAELTKMVNTSTRPGSIALGKGLSLQLHINGSNYWKFRYTGTNGEDKKKNFKQFPLVSVVEAKRLRDQNNELIRRGYSVAPAKLTPAVNLLTLEQAFFDWLVADKNFVASTSQSEIMFELEKVKANLKAGSTQPKCFLTQSGNCTKTLARKIRKMQRHTFPTLGKKRIADITALELTELLQDTEAQSAVAAERLRIMFKELWAWSLLYTAKTGVKNDITTALYAKCVLKPHQTRHRSSPTSPLDLQEVLEKIDGFRAGNPMTKIALQLALLTWIRGNELRRAEWSEFPENLETQKIIYGPKDKIKRVQFDSVEEQPDGSHVQTIPAIWIIPEHRMKRLDRNIKVNLDSDGQPRDHYVPISRQAAALLTELRKMTGKRKYLFPQLNSDKPVAAIDRVDGITEPIMSENTLNQALKNIGITSDVMTIHGTRAIAKTCLIDHGPYKSESDRRLIDHSLYHKVLDNNGRAYDRTARLAERVEMMQFFADWLDLVRIGKWDYTKKETV